MHDERLPALIHHARVAVACVSQFHVLWQSYGWSAPPNRDVLSQQGMPSVSPPVLPMLAKLATSLPVGNFIYEPKWDGFRALIFRTGNEVYIQSRDARPLDRYFPELHSVMLSQLPDGSVVDGEIVIATGRSLDFDALQMRLHPADSRVQKLARETPAAFVAFDVLCAQGHDLTTVPQWQRRAALEKLLSGVRPPIHLTPVTRELAVAEEWLSRFEGAGLDGVIAKAANGVYAPGKRSMIKVKHVRTAECVVAGFRWYKGVPGAVGSLLLGLYDDQQTLQHVGVASAFTMEMRTQLAIELDSLRVAAAAHPWRDKGDGARATGRKPGGPSRWSAGKDLSWEPLLIKRVCEVKYDHMQGDRFRHAVHFLRWRADRRPEECGYGQLAVTEPYELERIFSSGSSGS